MRDSLKLGKVVEVLDDMLSRGIIGEYAVGGAVAASLSYQPISTNDLDIFFLFEPPQTGLILSLEPIYNYAREHGLDYDDDSIHIGGWPVQFIESSLDPLWTEGLAKARTLSFDEYRIKVIPPEHLAVMWVQAGRGKDLRKIQEFSEGAVMNAGILHDLLQRFGYLDKWLSIQEKLSDEYKFEQ